MWWKSSGPGPGPKKQKYRGRVSENENFGPGPGPDSEKISGLISGPGTRNKPMADNDKYYVMIYVNC